MRLRHKCGGDCDSCRLGCRRNVEVSGNEKSHTDNGSSLEDIRKLGDYLSDRYTAQSLIAEIRMVYDPNYLAFFGIPGAMESYLTHFRDSMGLHIEREDIKKIASAIIERGDLVF